MLINGQEAPVIGRVCMDQLAVDIIGITNIKVGAVVTLIGADEGKEIAAPMVAELSGSITNELLSRMENRVKIVYKCNHV